MVSDATTSELSPTVKPAINKTLQMVCVWSGPVMIVGWVASFVLLAGFIPPPPPSYSPQQVVDMYQNNTGSIRLGLCLRYSPVRYWFRSPQ
jgi:hypothetical protein